VGRLLDWLEAHDLRQDTLVLFSSDNGMNMGHHGIFGKGNGTFPANMYDTSVKVPLLVSQPGSVPEGTVDGNLLSHYDLFPTLLEVAGTGVPPVVAEAASLPGCSFAALLRGQRLASDRPIVVCDEYGPTRMIRTSEWKYVHRYPYGPHELYDLANDPEERINLVDDPGRQDRLRELRGELADWFTRYVNPERDGTHEPVTGKGQLCLAGKASRGRKAFADDWEYLTPADPDHPRPFETFQKTGTHS
jgi:arylsulfatase A-like enzyme